MAKPWLILVLVIFIFNSDKPVFGCTVFPTKSSSPQYIQIIDIIDKSQYEQSPNFIAYHGGFVTRFFLAGERYQCGFTGSKSESDWQVGVFSKVGTPHWEFIFHPFDPAACQIDSCSRISYIHNIQVSTNSFTFAEPSRADECYGIQRIKHNMANAQNWSPTGILFGGNKQIISSAPEPDRRYPQPTGESGYENRKERNYDIRYLYIKKLTEPIALFLWLIATFKFATRLKIAGYSALDHRRQDDGRILLLLSNCLAFAGAIGLIGGMYWWGYSCFLLRGK